MWLLESLKFHMWGESHFFRLDSAVLDPWFPGFGISRVSKSPPPPPPRPRSDHQFDTLLSDGVLKSTTTAIPVRMGVLLSEMQDATVRVESPLNCPLMAH